MAPLFAVDSFVGLLNLEEGEIVAHLLDMVKECYESVTLHAFLMLMYTFCGLTEVIKNEQKPIPDEIKGRELHVPFPMSLLVGHPILDKKWLHRLRLWTIQFIILRPVLSTIDLVFVDIYPNDFSKALKIIITIALNLSVTTAFFALITFYHAFEHELASHRPLAKFLCIKGVVFFTTWQGVVLKALGFFGVLNEGYRFSLHEITLAWQDLLVCVEMAFIFSPLCVYAFSPPVENKDEGEKGVEMMEKKVKKEEMTERKKEEVKETKKEEVKETKKTK